jgi:hypothetical protein
LKPYIVDVDTNISNINIIVEDPNVMISGTSLVIFGSPNLPNEVDVYISDGEFITNGILEIQVRLTSPPMEGDDLAVYYFIVILIIIIVAILLTIFYLHVKRQQYDVEELFLIHNSGKLLSHEFYRPHSRFDDEIFSGMFTAIQEFIEDSFTRESADFYSKSSSKIKGKSGKSKIKPLKLNEFKAGDNQVIIEHGKFVFMAVVFRGAGSQVLHRAVRRSIRQIEKKYGERLEYWDGDMTHLQDLKQYLQKLLPKTKFSKKPEVEEHKTIIIKKRRRIPMAIPIKDFDSQDLYIDLSSHGETDQIRKLKRIKEK